MSRVALATLAGVLTLSAGIAIGDEPRCALQGPSSDSLASEACLECHDGRSGPAIRVAHPIGVYRLGPGLRPIQEAVRRGVLLPHGKIECVTCHDRRSPWKDHIALPPGARVLSAIDVRDPSSYERRPNWRLPGTGDPPLRKGSAVSAAPLCAACHTYAD